MFEVRFLKLSLKFEITQILRKLQFGFVNGVGRPQIALDGQQQQKPLMKPSQIGYI